MSRSPEQRRRVEWAGSGGHLERSYTQHNRHPERSRGVYLKYFCVSANSKNVTLIAAANNITVIHSKPVLSKVEGAGILK
jgi:hypothetical protein